MYWYIYNNTVHFVKYSENSKILSGIKFLNLALFCLPAYQPAVRPGSASAMAPDFSHKKGNRI